jgi:hypothetical protein
MAPINQADCHAFCDSNKHNVYAWLAVVWRQRSHRWSAALLDSYITDRSLLLY